VSVSKISPLLASLMGYFVAVLGLSEMVPLQVMVTGCDPIRLNIFVLIIYSFIHRKDNLDVGVVKCACILRGWSKVVQMARTPLRDSETISLDFDTILRSSDVLRFQITQSSDWIPPSATKKKSFLVGCDLAKSGRNLSYREIFIIVVSVTRALRGPSPLLRFFSIHVCLHTLFSGRYLQYHPIFGHSYSSFSL